METWNSYVRFRSENTLAGLKHALQKVNKNAFVCVWTDELGDDNNDAALRAEVMSLKASTQSQIFIMATKSKSRQRGFGSFSQFETTFGDLGYVMDITDPDVVDKMINLMKISALCNRNKTSTASWNSTPGK